MRRAALVLAAAVATLALGVPASASYPTVTYSGQGFFDDGNGPVLEEERCGLEADDGGTGQGLPGDAYLLWVLTLNATPADGVQLHLPDGEVEMIQVGGTWKYVSDFYAYDDMVGEVHATYSGVTVKGRVNLVVSHGCAPVEEEEGAWCSPGYWKNAADAAWALAGTAKTDLFNDTVVPGFYDTASIADPTLELVLNTPNANTFGSASGPFGLNAFNATGAYLTEQIPGYTFDPALIGVEGSCPLNNAGEFE
jgi:hypothetical protein